MKRYLLICLIIPVALVSCSHQPEYAVIDGLTQGTTYHIVVEKVPGLDLQALRSDIGELFATVDSSLSLYNKHSLISAINTGISDLTDTLLRELFHYAEQVWEQSGGLFDITVGPLVNAWGFGPDAIDRFDETMLDSLMRLTGMEKVRIVEEHIVKENPGIIIDLNGIAPGYTVDLAVALIAGRGVRECLVEIGGEVRTVGNKSGTGWMIGIDTPFDGNYSPGMAIEARIRLDDRALATSGNYRKFYLKDGVKYSHTIDPRTGMPVRHTLLSATIIAPAAALADAWATACMVGGREEAIRLIEKYDFLEGYLISSDEKGEMVSWVSDGIKNLISSGR